MLQRWSLQQQLVFSLSLFFFCCSFLRIFHFICCHLLWKKKNPTQPNLGEEAFTQPCAANTAKYLQIWTKTFPKVAPWMLTKCPEYGCGAVQNSVWLFCKGPPYLHPELQVKLRVHRRPSASALTLLCFTFTVLPLLGGGATP